MAKRRNAEDPTNGSGGDNNNSKPPKKKQKRKRKRANRTNASGSAVYRHRHRFCFDDRDPTTATATTTTTKTAVAESSSCNLRIAIPSSDLAEHSQNANANASANASASASATTEQPLQNGKVSSSPSSGALSSSSSSSPPQGMHVPHQYQHQHQRQHPQVPILIPSHSKRDRIPFSKGTPANNINNNNDNNNNDNINDNINIAMGRMSPRETELWSSSLGAVYAAKGSLPGHVCRKLGTITRVVWLPQQHQQHQHHTENLGLAAVVSGDNDDCSGYSASSKGVFNNNNNNNNNNNKKQPAKQTLLPKPPTITRAKKEIRQQQQQQQQQQSRVGDSDENNDDDDDDDDTVERKARALIEDWKRILERTGVLVPLWNQHGEIPPLKVGPVTKVVPITGVAGEHTTRDGANPCCADNIHSTTTMTMTTTTTTMTATATATITTPVTTKTPPITTTRSIRAIRSELESNRWREEDPDNNHLQQQQQQQQQKQHETNLYHLRIPTDARTVLAALEALAEPDPLLYNLPLVVAIPVLEPILEVVGDGSGYGYGDGDGKNGCSSTTTTDDSNNSNSNSNNSNNNSNSNNNFRPCRLTISVYAHRMMFECMTTDALRTVMAALDKDGNHDRGGGSVPAVAADASQSGNRDASSTTIVRPLVKAPAFGPEAFGTDPNTRVLIVVGEQQQQQQQQGRGHNDDRTTGAAASNDAHSNSNDNDNKNDNDDDWIIDGGDDGDGTNAEECPTRSKDTLDAFSTEGFLKLIENKGVAGVDSIYKNTIRPVLYGSNSNSHSHSHSNIDNSNNNNNNNQHPLLQVSLLPHQVHGVCWMYQMEHLEGEQQQQQQQQEEEYPSLGINGLLWETWRFREGDVFYYSPALGQARLTLGETPRTLPSVAPSSSSATATAAEAEAGIPSEAQPSRRRRFFRRRCSPKGGILADEMGLGKTVQAIALVLATLDELKQEAAYLQQQQHHDHHDHHEMAGGASSADHRVLPFYSHATLIVVPPALVGQWRNEIHKIAGSNLRVQVLDRHRHGSSKDSEGTMEKGDGNVNDNGNGNPRVSLDPTADVVLTTYQSLQGGIRTGSKKKKDKAAMKSTTAAANANAAAISKLLLSTVWGRVVLDEMQEVRSWNTITSKSCHKLLSHRRWMLSGTPLWEGIHDFRGELCFLGLEPFAANNEDGFFDFAVAHHWEERSVHGLEILKLLALVVLRRTKSMSILETGLPLLGLKNLNLVFEPVPQDPSERALYCCLESVMHATLAVAGEPSDNGAATATASQKNAAVTAARLCKQNRANRGLFLRLLRELCVSFYLLNGGLGCAPQLKELNQLAKKYNRKRLQQRGGGSDALHHRYGGDKNNSEYYSCDEAIRFLSQVEDVARTDDDFVTDQTVGGGGGLSRRNRALLIQPQEQLEASAAVLHRSQAICREARSSRARARWHWALEGVTSGYLLDDNECERNGMSESVVFLWRWRRNQRQQQICGRNSSNIEEEIRAPSWTQRGFRLTRAFFDGLSGETVTTSNNIRHGTKTKTEPTECYHDDAAAERSKAQQDRIERLFVLHKRRPEFRWAHPFSMFFSHIPVQVTEPKLRSWVENVLAAKRRKRQLPSIATSLPSSARIFRLSESKESQTWEAIVQLPTANDLDWFELSSKRVHGMRMAIQAAATIPSIEREIATRKKAVDDAEAMRIVHPSTQNERTLVKATAAYETAKLGLCVTARANHRPGHVVSWRAFGTFRGEGPKTGLALMEAVDKRIDAATRELAEHEAIVAREEKTIRSIRAKLDSSLTGTTAVESLNTFDVLQALKKGEDEKTNCPICYDYLGSGEDSNGKVFLTRCGHLSCKSCLTRWIDQKERQGSTVSCIECRKPIQRHQLIVVDPKKADKDHSIGRKKEAIELVQQAAKILEENYGQLEPHLWEALYLVIDLPADIDRNLHGIFTAIPGLFLGHLRNLLGRHLPVNAGVDDGLANATATTNLPSKFRALLADLPRTEPSVVFASSKSIVLHLQCVLQTRGIQSKTLYVGQSEFDSETAVADWESATDPAKVLIVQAGAAACGLTLTAASRMFLLEPFRKHEEEKQAYARLHRYGQTRAVHCTVYYAPVSVESRLLEWRRRAAAHAPSEEHTVYAPMRKNDPAVSNRSDYDDERSVLETKETNNGGGGGDDDVEEESQTRFLLGLSTRTDPTIGAERTGGDD